MDINKKFKLLTESPVAMHAAGKPSFGHPVKKSTTNTNSVGAEAKRLGLVHLGHGYYGKSKETGTTHQSRDGRLVALSPTEKSAHNKNLNKALTGNHPPVPPHNPSAGQPPMAHPMGHAQPPAPNPAQLGPSDYEDAPDIKKKSAANIKPVVPGKPTRERKMGSVTPGGDSKIKDIVIKKGLSDGIGAPGNAGSALNEILTGEALHRLLEQPGFANDEIGLALLLFKEYHLTALCKANTKGDVFKGGRDKRLIGLNKELYAKFLSTARAGMGEARRVTTALKTVEWTLKDTEIQHFYGAKESKLSMLEMVDLAIKKKKRIIGPDGGEIDPDEARKYVQQSGGGENPSDTATFMRNKSGDVMMTFTSNKLTPGDIQANSTPIGEIKDAKKVLLISGISQDEIVKASKLIDDMAAQIKVIESEIGNTVAPTAKFFLAGRGANMLKDLQRTMSSPPKTTGKSSDKNRVKRYQLFVQARFSSEKMNKKMATGLLSKESTMLQELMKRANPEWKGGNATDTQKLRAFLTLCADGKATADELKLLGRSASELPGVPSPQVALAEVRSQVIDSEFVLTRKLNQFMTKDNVPLGTFIEATKLQSKLHLTPAFKGEKHGIFEHDGLFAVNMGGVMVGPKQLTHCLGVDHRQDYLSSFRVGKPEYSRDKEGNITGSKVMVYRLDKDGEQRPIATRSIRSKQGATGKLDTTYFWAPSIQKCFASNQ